MRKRNGVGFRRILNIHGAGIRAIERIAHGKCAVIRHQAAIALLQDRHAVFADLGRSRNRALGDGNIAAQENTISYSTAGMRI